MTFRALKTAQSNNLSTGKLGVSRVWKTDYRRKGNPRALTYQVRWVDDYENVKVKMFHVGMEGAFTDADERAIKAKALAFREKYEAHRLARGW